METTSPVLQFGHGGDAVDDAASPSSEPTRATTFNSATAVTPWMTCTPGAQNRQGESDLQFGHGGDAVDDASQHVIVDSGTVTLQFGHGGDAVDDLLWTCEFTVGSDLQFGHGGDAVDDEDRLDADGLVEHPSIRPRR